MWLKLAKIARFSNFFEKIYYFFRVFSRFSERKTMRLYAENLSVQFTLTHLQVLDYIVILLCGKGRKVE
jgi:hypothetical protein